MRSRRTARGLRSAAGIGVAGRAAGGGGRGDPFYFNLTSGTTGLPKSYMMTQYNMSAMVRRCSLDRLSEHDVALTVFPMFGRVGFGWVAGTVDVRRAQRDRELRSRGGAAPDRDRARDDHEPRRDDGRDAAPATRLPGATSRRFAAPRSPGSALPEQIRRETRADLPEPVRVLRDAGDRSAGGQHARGPRRPPRFGRPAILSAEVRVVDDAGGACPPASSARSSAVAEQRHGVLPEPRKVRRDLPQRLDPHRGPRPHRRRRATCSSAAGRRT